MWRRRGAAAAQAQRRIHAHRSGFLVQEPDFPLPEIDRAAGGEEGFAGPQWNSRRVLEPVASNSWRRSESGTARMRMTMGLTLRRTARRINRLNEARMLILSGYAAQPDSQTPDFLALSKWRRRSGNCSAW